MEHAILINARAATRAQIGGVERWAREMATRLPALRPDAYAVARPPAGLAHRAGQAWEQFALPALAARRHAALIYSPANLAPVLSARNVLVLHDASTLRHPEWYSRPYSTWHRAVLPVLARRALQLVTVSEFSRSEIAATVGLDTGHIAVIAGGVDERFSPDADAHGAGRALGLHRPYALTVATPSQRKNLDALAPTASALADRGIDLVLAGGGRAYLPAQPTASGLHAVGYVDERWLPGLYAGAEAFVLASRYEGFGLTCLEAMASGVPVVAARAGALPDTCGEAALLVDPDDSAAIAAAVLACVSDEAERARLRTAGRERAAAFSWERAARETDALLAGLAGAST